jgi:uncharacterized protein (TIGR02996 family)
VTAPGDRMQTDTEPFLQRIRAYPDDNDPRLVFADWLEEQGGPGLARAAFIRVQIALATLPEGDPARPELLAAEKVLRDAHGADWEAPLRGFCSAVDFRRGFADEVRIGAVQFLRHAHELFAAGPVRHLHLLDAGHHLGPLTASPYLGRLAGLTVEAQHLRDPLAAAVARCPHLSGLRTLDLRKNRLTDAAAAALAGSPHLSNLESLGLAENELTDAGARTLAGSPHLGALRRLDLRQNPVGPVGAEAVAASERLADLEWLNLSGCGVGGPRLHTLARPGVLLRVAGLDLSGNALGAAGLKVLLTPPPDVPVRVRELDLSRNDLGEAGARVLAGAPALAGLRSLKLAECGLTDDAVLAVAASPHLTGLVSLDLGNNPAGDAAFEPFLDATPVRALRRLVTPAIGLSPPLRRALHQRYGGGGAV